MLNFKILNLTFAWQSAKLRVETKIVGESRLLYLKPFNFQLLHQELKSMFSWVSEVYLKTRRRQDNVIIQRVTAVTRQTVTGITRLSLSGWLSATVWDTGNSLQTVRLDKPPMLTFFPKTKRISMRCWTLCNTLLCSKSARAVFNLLQSKSIRSQKVFVKNLNM